MRATRGHQPGGPGAPRIQQIPRPEPRAGWERIRVRAFGLERGEMFTRQVVVVDA